MKERLKRLYTETVRRTPAEPEFHQAVDEILGSISPVIEEADSENALIYTASLLIPERVIMFKVPWINSRGQLEVNRGYRVQFNSALGPWKGGLRFHPSVSLGTMKFLAFEQIFKNALTGLPLGGAKGGSDFDPKGRTDAEIMSFCQSFMTSLYKFIGPDMDVPAGDMGVGSREIGFLFGQYKRLTGQFQGALTGKGVDFGGILGRTEATGHGLVYFLENMLNDIGQPLTGLRATVSGSGNVAIHAAKKLESLGVRIIAMSDSEGFISDPDGLDTDLIHEIKSSRERIRKYLDHRSSAKFTASAEEIWACPTDLALPCATQNELNRRGAEKLISNGVRALAEGANMPSTPEAIALFQQAGIPFGPAKAANAGGVAVSGLEMAQNSQRIPWTREQTEEKLKEIMAHIYCGCRETASQYGDPGNLVMGANIRAFKRVITAMQALGAE